MKPAHLTTDFLVTQAGPDLEIWVDWIPSVDGDPKSPVTARLEGNILVVEPSGDTANLRAARRVEGLDADVVEDVRKGFVWYVNGPSGVLAEHRLRPGV